MEETRMVILNNLEELKQKIKDINDQMDESYREVNFFTLFPFFLLSFSLKILLLIHAQALESRYIDINISKPIYSVGSLFRVKIPFFYIPFFLFFFFQPDEINILSPL